MEPAQVQPNSGRSAKRRIAHYIAVVFCIALAIAFGFGLADAIQRQNERSADARLTSVCMSIWGHCDAQRGYLPPLFVTDKDGVPTHSWRALILPQVCYEHVYKHYKFDEPWYGQDNIRFAGYLRDYSRLDDSKDFAFTNYVAVVGEDTLWPWPKTTEISKYRRSGEDTQWPDVPSPVKLSNVVGEQIFLVELVHSNILWTEPRDMSFETLAFLTTSDPSGNKLAQHVRRIATVDASGKIQIVDPLKDIERIARLVRRDP